MSRRYRFLPLALLLLPFLSDAQVVTYARVREIAYHDDAARWVMGQVAQTKVDGSVVSATTYHPSSLLPTQNSAFGKVQHTLTYHADGTLATVKDGNNRTTTLTNWKRGIPQSIHYADSRTETAVVNNAGWMTSVTDENGYTTGYSYDAMGRLAGIAYPTGDGMAWSNTTQAFVRVSSAEYGIPAGHWRQTVSTGNAVKVTYFDGAWRPLLVREYDAADATATQRFTRTAYDALGRVDFVSYPSTNSNPNTGVWTEHDALGRVTSVTQYTERSPALQVTTTEYLPGFQTRVINPRGVQTAMQYQAFAQPTTDAPVAVTTYAGADTAATELTRDAHGKPLTITRRNADGSVALTRYYAYNAHQELCKQWEPETRGSIFAYDGAGNLALSASGLSGVTADSSQCNADQFNAGRTVVRGYDARNRLLTLGFPDGNGDQTWTYTPDGLPESVVTYNSGNAVINTYTYNARRLLTKETMNPDAPDTLYNWKMEYQYNALGHVVREDLPANAQANYVVNALGQVTQASVGVPAKGTNTVVASGATYYPNGALKQFTYGNGIVHTMTQNARQLPSLSVDCAVTGSCAKANRRLHLTYAYDENGNVASIIDGTAGARQTRTMEYDGLDRLTGVTSTMFGMASYAYNALDNLTQVTVGASLIQPARDHHYCYGEGNNRLLFVRTGPQCTGTASPAAIALTYDVQGNLWTKNGNTHVFDYGNRLRSSCTGGGSSCNGVGGAVAYRYDALGRRVKQDSNGAQQRYSFYANDGRVIWQRDEVSGQRLHNLYFAGSLIAEFSRPIGSDTETISYQHTDALGSPIARTNASMAIIETSEYEPYGALVNRLNNDRPGYTGHVMDSATGLTYMQQRYFDAQLGIFGSVDPVTAYSNPVGMFNRYRGFNNNPYSFIDSDGRCGTRINGGKAINCRSYGSVPVAKASLNAATENTASTPNQTSGSGSSPPAQEESILETLATPWGGWNGLKDAIECIWKCGLPGDGSVDAQLAALPPVIGMPFQGVTSGFKLTATVSGHARNLVARGPFKGELARPFLNSELLVREIMSAGKARPDPGGVVGAMRWDVTGTFRGTQGTWELVVKDDLILHFNFVGN